MEILKLVAIAAFTIFALVKGLKFFIYALPIIVVCIYLFLKYHSNIF